MVRLMNIGPVIRAYRTEQRLSLRAFAPVIGISFVTLARLERGQNVDGETLAAVFYWLLSKSITEEHGKRRNDRVEGC